MKYIVDQLTTHPRYLMNIQYGKPRAGHPEGSVAGHIKQLEENLEILKPRISEEEYWKLMFMIHVHDTFKAESGRDLPILDPNSHASLARTFAAGYTDDEDILNMIQFHDENFALWRQYDNKGSFSENRFYALLGLIDDWRLFLIFLIVDGCTPGKQPDKIAWFINLVKEHKDVDVDETWVIKR